MIDLGEPYFPDRVGTKADAVQALQRVLDEVKAGGDGKARIRAYRFTIPKGVPVRFRCIFCTRQQEVGEGLWVKAYLDADLVDTWIKHGGLAAPWQPFFCQGCVEGPLREHYKSSAGPVVWPN